MSLTSLWLFVCLIQVPQIYTQVMVVKTPKKSLDCISVDDGIAMIWNDHVPPADYREIIHPTSDKGKCLE